MDLSTQLRTALAGRYDLEREIGVGGMAVVYLARDLKHDRRIALKVLRPELGAVLGAERFLSEIKVTANLQHPNLLPLFDSGEVDGRLFYVMPYVEGESLRKRLDRERQLPIEAALHIATSVASALDYAHRQGVIHRDLKPENILLHDGEPLVADFGIALAVSNAGGDRVTQTGLSLGTPQYMSPEQATGDRGVDGRSDIYSLAAVTYEMLAGEPPHIGNSSQAIIARVLTERPRPVRVTRPSVPEHVDHALAKALEKLPADRFASARELADALTGRTPVGPVLVDGGRTVTPSSASTSRRDKATRVALVAITMVSLATVSGVLVAREPEPPEVRFDIPLLSADAPHQIAISADGSLVAFVSGQAGGGHPILWVRALNDTDPRPLPGTELARWAFSAPDGRHIGYFDGSTLEKVDVRGGAPQTVSDLSGQVFWGGSWNADGVILFSAGGELYTVSDAGGTPTALALDPQPADARFPVFLPDGRGFLFLAWSSSPSERAIYAGSLDGGAPVRVTDAEAKPVYVEPGYLLFRRGATLFAQRFDPDRFSVSGDPVAVAEDVLYNDAFGANSYAASLNGVLIFRSGTDDVGARELQWLGRDGRVLGTAGEPGPFGQIRLSPDQGQVAIRTGGSTGEGAGDVWTLDLATNIRSRLTFDAAFDEDPVWLPDSDAIAYVSNRTGMYDIYSKVLGASTDRTLLESPESKATEDVSRDGRFLLYRLNGTRLMALPLTGDPRPIALSDSIFGRQEGRFSPDGRTISYGSTESGSWEVHVASFPAFDNRRQVSSGGGVQARWRADGRELFYLTTGGAVMSVAVRDGAVPVFDAPKLLFQSPLANPSSGLDQYDVTGDGQRFLFVVPHEQERTLPPITVVVNWRRALSP
jgi:eukaryotic-like serine/threonine-protein kinase